MDRDETPVGGLAKPMQPTRQLFYVTMIMDTIAVLLSFFITAWFALGVLLYILASRAYSYRGIRLKKYPVAGFLTVVICQGMLVFWCSYHAAGTAHSLQVPLLPLLTAGLLIGGSYPLTQVYQHEADNRDGVQTISMLLGVKGTFIFCGIVFLSATVAMFLTFSKDKQPYFFVFAASMLPMIIFFSYWFLQVLKDTQKANFKNSLYMNILASCCTTLAFSIILIMQRL